jgi:hypothetical protein
MSEFVFIIVCLMHCDLRLLGFTACRNNLSWRMIDSNLRSRSGFNARIQLLGKADVGPSFTLKPRLHLQQRKEMFKSQSLLEEGCSSPGLLAVEHREFRFEAVMK